MGQSVLIDLILESGLVQAHQDFVDMNANVKPMQKSITTVFDSRGTVNSPTRWTELLMHQCRDGGRVLYLYRRTLWQGESNGIEVLALDDAQLFAEEHYEDLDTDDEQLRA